MILTEGEREPGPFDKTQTNTGKGQAKNEIMYYTKIYHCAKCFINQCQLLCNRIALVVYNLCTGHHEAAKVQILASWLVLGACAPQRITSGLRTNFNLSLSYSLTGHYTTSFFSSNHDSNYIHNFRKQNPEKLEHMFWSLFTLGGHSTIEPASSRVTYFTLGAYTGTGVNS